jgi:curved DNA-binding protein CbpA
VAAPEPEAVAAPEPEAVAAPEPEAEAAPEPEARPPTPAQTPADQHVFFEPSRKKVVEPEPEDDRDPHEIVRMDHAEKMDLNHYGFLEIGQDATGAEIEDAYGRLAPAYRPRNLGADASDDDKRKARALLARLVSAHEELSEPKRRARYDLSEASRKPGKRGALKRDIESWDDEDGAGSAATRTAGAAEGPWYPGQHDPEEIDRRAEDLDSEDAETLRAAHGEIQRGEYKKAFARLDELRALDPSNSFVLADLGWCRFRDNPGNEREIGKALEWAELALAFEPGNRNALEVKARVLMSQSDPSSGAGVVLRNLIKVAPGHEWATGQLSRFESLQAAAEAEDKPGGLRGMLGRKK